MAIESTVNDPETAQKAAEEAIAELQEPGNADAESDNEDEAGDEVPPAAEGSAGAAAAKKKKKSKKKRIKEVLTGKGGESSDPQAKIAKAVDGLSEDNIKQMLELNPSLAQELGLGNLPMKDVAARVKKLDLADIMTGLAENGKNVKDMGSYKFWGTQPVPKLGEHKDADFEEKPFKIVDIEKVPKEPSPMLPGFEWVTMDVTDTAQVQEIYDLLYGHYVEDNAALFRFKYSPAFLKWSLQSPGWHKDWHVGVRATESRKLVAFISAVPVELRVRKKVLHASEVNFLCIHKKLRAKRLTPVLIKEVTRRCYLKGTFQAVYTAGVVLPTPVSTSRYYHRSINWQKLYDIGFSPLPYGSKPSYQISKYALPDKTATKGLRPMVAADLEAVTILLKKYLDRFDIAPEFTKEEVEHWMLYNGDGEQVVWCYVVEDPTSKAITDFFSFYSIESSVMKSAEHKSVSAAYMFYYASDVALSPSTSSGLKARLNSLMNDALIIAKKAKFDVFNALTISDNNYFLEEQKFGAGDGQLHYYLYNYLAKPIAGGVDKQNRIESHGSGVGLVML